MISKRILLLFVSLLILLAIGGGVIYYYYFRNRRQQKSDIGGDTNMNQNDQEKDNKDDCVCPPCPSGSRAVWDEKVSDCCGYSCEPTNQ